jgi:hypothetical protein
MVGSCENCNGPSISIKSEKFLDQLRDCQFLKDCSQFSFTHSTEEVQYYNSKTINKLNN